MLSKPTLSLIMAYTCQVNPYAISLFVAQTLQQHKEVDNEEVQLCERRWDAKALTDLANGLAEVVGCPKS